MRVQAVFTESQPYLEVTYSDIPSLSPHSTEQKLVIKSNPHITGGNYTRVPGGSDHRGHLGN